MKNGAFQALRNSFAPPAPSPVRRRLSACWVTQTRRDFSPCRRRDPSAVTGEELGHGPASRAMGNGDNPRSLRCPRSDARRTSQERLPRGGHGAGPSADGEQSHVSYKRLTLALPAHPVRGEKAWGWITPISVRRGQADGRAGRRTRHQAPESFQNVPLASWYRILKAESPGRGDSGVQSTSRSIRGHSLLQLRLQESPIPVCSGEINHRPPRIVPVLT